MDPEVLHEGYDETCDMAGCNALVRPCTGCPNNRSATLCDKHAKGGSLARFCAVCAPSGCGIQGCGKDAMACKNPDCQRIAEVCAEHAEPDLQESYCWDCTTKFLYCYGCTTFMKRPEEPIFEMRLTIGGKGIAILVCRKCLDEAADL